ncbi:hypothetical protein Rsub_10049 [Raphidocelis subcapitata]|uniref:Uncharacterized protein n=1 Tax=Raphidocelis subcapitata TaxID=307507 RepID=A0A2V0PBF5_9CHLO|nr:hypothetical protein Rsub_10049 [Raphidocelis subcapitata]|eukprot:GBF97188.1 hypothetical protein Rsub_10049 [Raphidocelis subcapitata]
MQAHLSSQRSLGAAARPCGAQPRRRRGPYPAAASPGSAYHTRSVDGVQERTLGITALLADQEVQDSLLEGWSDRTATLALGSGFFAVENDGTAWWQDIPHSLSNKCIGRQKSLPPVEYVALGPGESYFVQFVDGHQQWWADEGLDDLTEALHSYSESVKLLAFAHGGGYYILWEDGHSQWYRLPQGLYNQLNGRKHPCVEFLSLGPNDEWFVRFLNGKGYVAGHSELCQETMAKLKAKGRSVLKIMYGEGGTWAIVHEHRSK